LNASRCPLVDTFRGRVDSSAERAFPSEVFCVST
jgi:hypothetical protein